MIELRLLGGVDLRARDGRKPELILAHEKIFALLAYLAAAHPFGSHRRDSLVGLLWPELDQDHARTALRKSVHALRQSLGSDAIVSVGEEAVAIADAVVWCDVRAFESAVHDKRPTVALDLYRGDLLPGTFLADAPEFEHWVERERQGLRATALRAAWAAAADFERAGNVEEAVRWGRRAFQLAPDDEHTARQLIALLDRLGDSPGSIRVYEQFERYLAKELEIAPSAETASLIASIRTRAPPKVGREAVPRVAASSSGLTAVGEDRESIEAPITSDNRSTVRWRARALWATALGLILTVFSIVAAVRHQARAATSLENTKVVVMPLENATGRRDLDFVGLEVQDWISRGLQETGLVRVYPVTSGLGPTGARQNLSSEDDRKSAAGLGAGTLIRGRYYLRADSILMEISIVDVAGANALATLAPVVGSTKDPTPAIDVVRKRTIAVLATHVDPALSQWASAASEPPSFEAYKEFSAGQQAQNRDDYDGAIGHYVRAATLDSGYVYPILIAAELEMQVRSEDSAASLLRTVRNRHLHLAPFDDALADALEAGLARDFEREFDAEQRLRQYVMPGSDWELDAASVAISLNRPRIAMEIVKSVDLHRPGVLDRWDVFVPITNAYHLSGDNAGELALLKKEAEPRWQGAPFVVVVEMQALAALGRPAEADSLWLTLLHNTPAERRGIVMWAAWMGASELRAHGFPDAARTLARKALDSLPVLPSTSPWGDPMRWRMQVLREAGRDREALPIARTIAEKNPHEAQIAMIVGAISARMGDTVTARRIEADLAHWPTGSDPSGILVPRARLAAALGDKANAVALLHTACDKGCYSFEDLHIMLEFDALRSYPPFQALLRPRPGF